MKIDYISPKKIKVVDKSYTDTIIVSSKGIVFSWEESEVLEEKDIEKFLKEDPEVLVVARNGDLKKVPFKARNLLKEKDVILIVDDIHEAINSFNKTAQKGKSVLGVFPLKS